MHSLVRQQLVDSQPRGFTFQLGAKMALYHLETYKESQGWLEREFATLEEAKEAMEDIKTYPAVIWEEDTDENGVVSVIPVAYNGMTLEDYREDLLLARHWVDL